MPTAFFSFQSQRKPHFLRGARPGFPVLEQGLPLASGTQQHYRIYSSSQGCTLWLLTAPTWLYIHVSTSPFSPCYLTTPGVLSFFIAVAPVPGTEQALSNYLIALLTTIHMLILFLKFYFPITVNIQYYFVLGSRV